MTKPSASYYKQEVDKAIAAIKFLKTQKPARTPEEKQLLLGFCGGGVLKEAGIFTNADSPRWLVEKREELRSLINRDEWAFLQNAGMLNAHYTRPEITTEIWRFVASFLKPGDKVLDPGCGTGRFYSHCPPEIKYVGVDNEPLSVAIAKAAHQGISIYCKDFLQWKYPQEFQGVVGNIPFVNGVKTYYLENQKLALGLHAQFFCKSIFHLQEGGVLALLTSMETLDAKGEDYVAFRRWVDKQCHFLGAVRLPSGAVHDGGTEVTTDLVLLQKRKLGDKTPNPNWIETVGTGLVKQYMEKSEEIRINQWYADCPNFVLGELGFDPLTQGKRSAAIAREGQNVVSDLRNALNKIKGGNMGYTHYWWQPRMLNSKDFESFMKSVKRLKDNAPVPVLLELNRDYPRQYYVAIDEIDDKRCENAFFKEYRECDWDEEKGLFKTYCKTGQKKYDQVVFAAMLAFAYHFPHDVKIGSDGELTAGDFDEGIALFEKVFGLKVEIEQPDPTRSSVPLIIKFIEKENETMTNASATIANWEAFQVRFVDKKGKEAGDAAVQIHFPVKPPEKVTDTLGKVGFTFHSNGAKYWYAYLTGEVPQQMRDKGIENIEGYVRGLVKAYSAKGAHVSQEKPKSASTPQAPAPQGGMLRMLKEMADEIRALRSEVAEIKERSANSAELEKLKAQHETELSKLDNLNLRLGEKVNELQGEVDKLKAELHKKEEVINSQALSVQASAKKIADLETASKIMLDEKDRIIADQKQTIATAIAEVDRISSRYDTLVKSLNDQGFTAEDFLSEAPQEEVAVSFDDTPAISFDSDEPEPEAEEAEPLGDDAGDDRNDAATSPSGDAADSGGFDFEELDEAAEEEGFDPDLMDDLGK